MATNKERIEKLESALGGLQESFGHLEQGMIMRFRQLELTIAKTAEAILNKQEPSSSEGSSLMGRRTR